jgi:hypothetical protein
MRARLRSRRFWGAVGLIFVIAIAGWSSGTFGLLLLAILAVPVVLARTFGATWKRAGVLVLLGFVIAAALFFAAYFVSPTEPSDCSDCTEVWGRWWEPGLLLYWLTLLLMAWIVGVLIGAALRRR